MTAQAAVKHLAANQTKLNLYAAALHIASAQATLISHATKIALSGMPEFPQVCSAYGSEAIRCSILVCETSAQAKTTAS